MLKVTSKRFVLKTVLGAAACYALAEFLQLGTAVCCIVKMMPALLCAYYTTRIEASITESKVCDNAKVCLYCRSMMVGFVFCSFGDQFLRLDDAYGGKTKFFMLGLISFLVGHILFVLAMVWDGGNTLCPKWGLFSYSFVSIIIYFALPNIEKVALRCGVAVYALVIGTMVHRAASLATDRYAGDGSSDIAFKGALVFLASDAVLAVNRFVAPLPYSRIVNISTYFVGIALLVCSCAGETRWLLKKDT